MKRRARLGSGNRADGRRVVVRVLQIHDDLPRVSQVHDPILEPVAVEVAVQKVGRQIPGTVAVKTWRN